MIAPARMAAFELLQRIELQQEHSDDALNSDVVDHLEPRDRNLVTEIVYGTLRWRGWLDYILEGTIARDWEAVEYNARILLRLSLYQMTRMDRVPDRAVIHDAVELAKTHLRRRGSGFVNGVLRNLGRQRPWLARDFHRDSPVWVRVSLPAWLWDRWEQRFGPDRACEYAISLNRQPQAAFRVREAAKSEGAHLEGQPSDLVPGAFLLGARAQCKQAQGKHFQDEASQLIPHLLGSIDGAHIWDACAAPGGKSSILTERFGLSGRLISSDLDHARTLRMREVFKDRLGRGVELVVADARGPIPFRESFDAVLADVPCSGLGTLRRNPDIKWRVQPEWLGALGQKQGQILGAVAGAVRKGGRLLYSTCSTEPEENEQVVERFLETHPEFSLEKPTFPPGVESWLDSAGLFRSYPSPRLWDAFFAALMTRG